MGTSDGRFCHNVATHQKFNFLWNFWRGFEVVKCSFKVEDIEWKAGVAACYLAEHTSQNFKSEKPQLDTLESSGQKVCPTGGLAERDKPGQCGVIRDIQDLCGTSSLGGSLVLSGLKIWNQHIPDNRYVYYTRVDLNQSKCAFN